MKLTHAIILAAGLGTRMRPLTNDLPKPLIAVKGKALIDWCIDWLAAADVHEVVVNSSYLAEKLEAHLSASKKIRISREPSPPLETGGGIAKALPLLGDEPFIAMNSDAIFASPRPSFAEEGANMATPAHPIKRLCAEWSDNLDFLMLLVHRRDAVGWEGSNGDFVMDASGRIRRPREGEEAAYIFTGVEIIHPHVFDGCPAGAFSLNALWNARLGSDGWFTRIRAVVHDGAWLNVGDLHGLKAAEAYGATTVAGSWT